MAKKTIKAQMQQRRDTKANWAATNPVLLDGELGIVSDDPNLYKVGDGATAWNSLPFRGFDGTLAQELGTSPNAVISQKVVSEKLSELESEIKISEENNDQLYFFGQGTQIQITRRIHLVPGRIYDLDIIYSTWSDTENESHIKFSVTHREETGLIFDVKVNAGEVQNRYRILAKAAYYENRYNVNIRANEGEYIYIRVTDVTDIVKNTKDIAEQNNVIGVSEYKDFSEAEAVNVGDVRKYNGYLYECIEATEGVWDSSKWKKSSFKTETEKRFDDLYSDTNTKLSELESEIYAQHQVDNIKWIEAKAVDVKNNKGELRDSPLNSASNFINVNGTSRIIITENVAMASNSVNGLIFYDENKVVIDDSGHYYLGSSGLSENSYQTKEYIVPKNAHYLRTTFYTSFLHDFKLELINENSLEFQLKHQLKQLSFPVIGSPTMVFSDIPENRDLTNTLVGDVYARYDLLCDSYPEWISRKADIGLDSAGNPIRHYEVRNYNAYVRTLDDSSNIIDDYVEFKRFLINAGTHGDEKSAVWGALLFVEKLITNDEEWSNYILSNSIIDIIPILNPYGFDNYTRESASGININRAFYNTNCVEAMALKNLALAHRYTMAIDCHGVSAARVNLGYISANSENPQIDLLLRFYNNLFGAFQRNWKTLAQQVGQDKYPYYYAVPSVNQGTFVEWMWKEGVTYNAITAEALRQDNSPNMYPLCKLHIDILANFIQAFIR